MEVTGNFRVGMEEVVTKVNDDNTKVNMNEILKDLKVDTTETIKTNTELT